MPELRRPVRLAWRRATCGSSDHGLPALRDEPILGFRADEFHRTVAPELPFSLSGAAQSDAGRGIRAIPGVHSFHRPRVDESGRSAFPARERGRKRDRQWLRSRRIYESGCRSQSFAGFKTVCRPNDVAFHNSVEPYRTPTERNPLSVFRNLPARRLEIRLGKFQLVDFFDLNSAGSDSHLQFLNLTVDNNGAYDYAADTRGYTVAAMLDFEDHNWGVRFAEALMPRQANFIDLEWNLSRARSENIEFELRKGLLPHRNGVVRLMSYINHANIGGLSGSDSAI